MNLNALLQGYSLEKQATLQYLEKQAKRPIPKKVVSEEEADNQDEIDNLLAAQAQPSGTWSNLLPYLLGAGALGAGGYAANEAGYLDKIKAMLGLGGKTQPTDDIETAQLLRHFPEGQVNPINPQEMTDTETLKFITKMTQPNKPIIPSGPKSPPLSEAKSTEEVLQNLQNWISPLWQPEQGGPQPPRLPLPKIHPGATAESLGF